jgi:hypothetical protein
VLQIGTVVHPLWETLFFLKTFFSVMIPKTQSFVGEFKVGASDDEAKFLILTLRGCKKIFHCCYTFFCLKSSTNAKA